MIRHHRLMSALLLTSSLLTGCGRREDASPPKGDADTTRVPEPRYDPEEIVAYVNDARLLRGKLENDVTRRVAATGLIVPRDRGEAVRNDLRRHLVRQFIVTELFLQEADRLEIVARDKDRALALERLKATLPANVTIEEFFRSSPLGREHMEREFERSLRIERLVQSQVEGKARVTDADIADMRRHAMEKRRQRREEIEALREQLLAGADFGGLARMHSDCPSSGRDGDLGTFPRGIMPEAFEAAAFQQSIGEIGPIVDTPSGFHVIMVRSRTPGRPAEDNQPEEPETATASHILLQAPTISRRALMDQLRRDKEDAMTEIYLKSLYEQANTGSIFPDIEI